MLFGYYVGFQGGQSLKSVVMGNRSYSSKFRVLMFKTFNNHGCINEKKNSYISNMNPSLLVRAWALRNLLFW